MLSTILTLSVLFPGIDERTILGILVGGSFVAIIVALGIKLAQRKSSRIDLASANAALLESEKQRRELWRMPPLDQLPASIGRAVADASA